MQKIKTFLRSFVRSCTSPKYYAEIIKTRFSFSLKYLFVFQLATTLIIALFVMIPLAAFNAVDLLNNLKSVYPSDLDMTVQDGRLSINQPLPYRVALPGMIQDDMMLDSGLEGTNEYADIRYLAVFESDEYVQGADDVFDQNAFMVFTESTMYIREDDGRGLRVYPIPEGEDFTLTSGMVNDTFSKITNSAFVQYKLYLPLVFLFFVLIFLPMMIVFSLLVVALFGFFVWLMTKLLAGPLLAGQALSYTKAVQVSIHSLTLINVLQALLGIIGEGELLTGGKFLLAFLAWTAFVLHQSFHMPGKPGAAAARATVTDTTPVVPTRKTSKVAVKKTAKKK